MLPVQHFINPELGTFGYNAVLKALKERPRVRKIGRVDRVDYYLVEKTSTLGIRRVVQVWEDKDRDLYLDLYGIPHVAERGEFWIECSCPAGTPREDVTYNNLCWLPKPCYHAGAVLLYIAEEEEKPPGQVISFPQAENL